MKKIIAIVAALIFSTICCAEKPEEAMANLMSRMIKINNEASQALSRAATGKAAGEALVAYAKSINNAIKDGEKLAEKFSEFDTENSPSLEKLNNELEKAQEKLNDEIAKAYGKFSSDPDFNQAAQKMQELIPTPSE